MLVVIKKYKLHTTKIKSYRFIIKLKKLSINLKKIKAVLSWRRLKSITKLQLFLKFCNYYKKFIKYQSNKIKLFTRLTRKEKPQE